MPNLTVMELRRLQEIERKYEALRDKEMLAPFAAAFSNALGTLAANTPQSAWPEQFHAAFRHVKTQMPMLAELYLMHLPEAK